MRSAVDLKGSSLVFRATVKVELLTNTGLVKLHRLGAYRKKNNWTITVEDSHPERNSLRRSVESTLIGRARMELNKILPTLSFLPNAYDLR